MRRFSVAPLEAAARGWRPAHHPHHCVCLAGDGMGRDLGVCATTDDIAAALGIGARTLFRKRHTGLTRWEADRLAVRIGRHPVEIWPDFNTYERNAA